MKSNIVSQKIVSNRSLLRATACLSATASKSLVHNSVLIHENATCSWHAFDWGTYIEIHQAGGTELSDFTHKDYRVCQESDALNETVQRGFCWSSGAEDFRTVLTKKRILFTAAPLIETPNNQGFGAEGIPQQNHQIYHIVTCCRLWYYFTSIKYWMIKPINT